MTRFLGQKPVNWAATILVFGWMALALLGIAAWLLGGLDGFSIFRRDLTQVPLSWEPDMSFAGFVLVMSPMLLGGLACWLVPASGHDPALSRALVALGMIGVLFGLAWDARSGQALYLDRVVTRGPGFTSRLEEHRLSDVVRVEASCVRTRRRRSSGWDPGANYWVFFRDGRQVEVWDLARGRERLNSTAFLDRLDVINAAATRAGAVRAPRRRPDGKLLGNAGCVPLLAERMGVSVSRLAPFFNVQQSELREGEYIVVPLPSSAEL